MPLGTQNDFSISLDMLNDRTDAQLLTNLEIAMLHIVA